MGGGETVQYLIRRAVIDLVIIPHLVLLLLRDWAHIRRHGRAVTVIVVARVLRCQGTLEKSLVKNLKVWVIQSVLWLFGQGGVWIEFKLDL